jgi:4-amino-4-deoxy-L-arabinose transferase-like glycosyltransferase
MLFPVKNKFSLLIVSLILLAAAAFVVRVWGLTWFHSWDEMVYLQNAKVICCGKTNYSELDFRPPLLSILFAGVFLLWNHIYAASVLAAAINALAPLFLFLAGRRSVGALPAALASLLLAFGPFFVGVFPANFDSDITGNGLLTDSPALTLVVLGLWLMLRALEAPKLSRFALAGFACSMAILMRFGSIPSVGVLCLLPILSSRRWRAWTATAVGVLAGLGPYLLWSYYAYGGFFYTLQGGEKNVEGPAPPFTFYLVNAPVIFTWIGVFGLLLAAAAALIHFLQGLRAKSMRPAGFGTFGSGSFAFSLSASPRILKGFLWLWLLAGFLFFSCMPHKEPRYILPVAPAVLLLSGSGLALLCRLPGRFLRPAGALLLSAAMAVTFLPTASRFADPFFEPGRPEELEASTFLNATFSPATPLYMNFNYPAFAYFTNFQIHELPIGGPPLYQAIDEIPTGGILIAYRESESGDPKVEVLDRDPALEVVKAYSSLVIYRRRQKTG